MNRKIKRKTEIKTLHFDLGHGHPDAEFKLHVGMRKYPLKRHTNETRNQARKTNQALAMLPDHRISHYVEDIKLPADSAQLLLVSCSSRVKGAHLDTLMLSCIHVPKEARKEVLKKRITEGHYTLNMPHPTFKMFGINVNLKDHFSLIIDVHDWNSAMDAAISIVFQHNELLNIDPTTAAKVIHTIQYSNGISDLAKIILDQATAHQKDPDQDNWVIEEPWLNPDGTPIEGKYRYVWTDLTIEWTKGPMIDSLKRTKNESDLQSTGTTPGCYSIQYGKTSVDSEQESPGPRTAAIDISEVDYYWTLNNLTPHHGYENQGGITMTDQTFFTQFMNSWLRWLSVYVEFLGSDYKTVIKPDNWQSLLEPNLSGTYDSDTKKYAQIVSSAYTVLGIPVGNTPTEVTFQWPSNASGVKIMSGGLGRTGGIQGDDGKYYGGWDKQVCTPGAIMTGAFNLGIPVLCLAFAAPINLASLNEIAKSSFSIILDLARFMVDGPIASSFEGGNTETILTAFANCIIDILLEIPELVLWIDTEIAEGAAEEAIPIFGWVAAAIAIASDLLLLSQSIVEVTSSPATFEMVATRAMDIEWTLLPDKEHQDTWPREATHYLVSATYKDGTTHNTKGAMSSPQTGPIRVIFNKVPAGGQVMLAANFYSDTNWICGKATTQFMPAKPTSGTTMEVPPMNIKENLIPLTEDTHYEFNNKLVYMNGVHKWSNEEGPPTATIKNLDYSNIGHNLAKLLCITISQETSQLGYAWQASGQNLPFVGQKEINTGQMFTFQTIDDRTDPQSGLRFVPGGFPTQPLLVYDIYGPKDGNGMNFFIDPRDDQYHLRQVKLDGSTQPFDLSTGKSWGRFNEQIDSCVIHPSGYAVGVSTTNCKLEVLRLPHQACDDTDAPIANMYSGYGKREGLVHHPIGIAITPNAGVVVLEKADSNLNDRARLQAFDLLGNPTKIFANNTVSFVYLKEESRGMTCLDLAIESKGFIYVLKYMEEGSTPSDYLLDIYNPDGSFLNQTAGISAAKIAVDLWRTLFTLNFEIIVKPDDGSTEPSVSIWLPSTPVGPDA